MSTKRPSPSSSANPAVKKKGGKSPQPNDETTANQDQSKVEGEGSYTAARRHRDSVEDYIESHDVERDAREAAPDDAQEAQEMADAEKEGKRPARS